jgi:hypothetical protein
MNIVDFVNRFQYFFAKYFSLVANILVTGVFPVAISILLLIVCAELSVMNNLIVAV